MRSGRILVDSSFKKADVSTTKEHFSNCSLSSLLCIVRKCLQKEAEASPIQTTVVSEERQQLSAGRAQRRRRLQELPRTSELLKSPSSWVWPWKPAHATRAVGSHQSPGDFGKKISEGKNHYGISPFRTILINLTESTGTSFQ